MMTQDNQNICNIAAYKFVKLSNETLNELQGALQNQCGERNLKGTILLSPEGVNLFLAGAEDAITRFRSFLTSFAVFSDLTFKVSFSKNNPFQKMRVKIKSQIIPMSVPDVHPAQSDTERISPKDLKKWLDESRDFTLLDTRNDYEVEFGTFKNARHLDIKTFRDFPKAIEGFGQDSETKPLVLFCTGGIRCEKAVPLMLKKGFKNVLQLDGGILKYFEEVGSEHYDGECFVFDERVALTSELQPSGIRQCPCCFRPFRDEEHRAEGKEAES
ncbi:MAG: rhodanese-like domain-containing protein [bacterium]